MLSPVTFPNLTLAFLLAALIAALAWKLGALDRSGAIAATLLGGIVYGLGGLQWAILLIAFFASSSLLSLAFPDRKRKLTSSFAKGGRRDWAQVLANGGLGATFLILAALGLIPVPLAWLAFAAALATVTADTWATELGVLSPSPPRLINTWQPMPRGSSGAISLAGTAASLLGAGFIAVLAFLLVPLLNPLAFYSIIALAGLLGSLTDSFLGATVQASYYCPHCEEETERHPLHSCGTATIQKRGWSWLNNDWVNFISAFFATAVALLAATAFGLVA
jgi:uncharacterized protein (TIGR00297 family)